VALRFVDTNVLLYSISHAQSDHRKRERAVEILEDDNLALSAQVLQEFYWQATSRTRPDPISHRAAVALITAWSRFPVQEISLDIVKSALEICARHNLSYWDSAIIAAAQAMGCEQLLSEDLQHGRHIGSLLIVNPFV
jgi:predicted nucleic acid-binding protein